MLQKSFCHPYDRLLASKRILPVLRLLTIQRIHPRNINLVEYSLGKVIPSTTSCLKYS